MSQLSEIPASTYTLEMETLGALPDISTFDGEPVLVSQNPLTPGTRRLQLLPLPGIEFPVRYETSRMRGFQFEVNLGKAHSGGSATDASAFWDLLDPPMRARAERIRTRLAAWRELPVEARPAAPVYTREERDQAARSFLFYIISSQLLCTSQNKGDLAMLACLLDLSQVGSLDWATLGLAHLYHGLDVWTRGSDQAVLACLRDLSQVGSFDWATLGLAHLYHGLDVWTRGSGESNWRFIRPLEERKTHKTAAHYRAEAIAEAPPPVQLDPEHTTHVPAQRYQEICQRFGFARSYIGRLYSNVHERDLEIEQELQLLKRLSKKYEQKESGQKKSIEKSSSKKDKSKSKMEKSKGEEKSKEWVSGSRSEATGSETLSVKIEGETKVISYSDLSEIFRIPMHSYAMIFGGGVHKDAYAQLTLCVFALLLGRGRGGSGRALHTLQGDLPKSWRTVRRIVRNAVWKT
ncbi:hypothetical protein JCGZ_03676 [Jatropha curcas]|uniref:Aminotransferase-like plant mobile domain-containing protein n=1 Tax=Jatropha curcas TaxID=180498 RepID=A0A067L5K8_JATCU|nr:hypothetical protein JCGZ_03676 [Jatropha curcas]